VLGQRGLAYAFQDDDFIERKNFKLHHYPSADGRHTRKFADKIEETIPHRQSEQERHSIEFEDPQYRHYRPR
jgi:hypothetical protein